MVTPFVGVWIEIYTRSAYTPKKTSLPSWECGLKLDILKTFNDPDFVTPFVGVWIEIQKSQRGLPEKKGHSLRGSVD